MDFYNNIAGFYDDMTRYSERIDKEKAVWQKILAAFPFKSALDMACGSGLHAVILHELGVRVTGMDPSTEMLRLAADHARSSGYNIAYFPGIMQEPHPGFGKFDAVLCLGNSIPHVLNNTDLVKTIANFSALLNPHGLLIIQLLNYNRILQDKNRIVNISRQGENEFIRFYDFLESTLQFNILSIACKEGKTAHRLESVILKPWQAHDFLPLLELYNFSSLELWGGMNMQPFAADSSTDLVIKAVKG